LAETLKVSSAIKNALVKHGCTPVQHLVLQERPLGFAEQLHNKKISFQNQSSKGRNKKEIR
jgi:hypothetical protein